MACWYRTAALARKWAIAVSLFIEAERHLIPSDVSSESQRAATSDGYKDGSVTQYRVTLCQILPSVYFSRSISSSLHSQSFLLCTVLSRLYLHTCTSTVRVRNVAPSPPWKLFAIFSLVVNLHKAWLLPKHIPMFTPVLVHSPKYMYELYHFYE